MSQAANGPGSPNEPGGRRWPRYGGEDHREQIGAPGNLMELADAAVVHLLHHTREAAAT